MPIQRNNRILLNEILKITFPTAIGATDSLDNLIKNDPTAKAFFEGQFLTSRVNKTAITSALATIRNSLPTLPPPAPTQQALQDKLDKLAEYLYAENYWSMNYPNFYKALANEITNTRVRIPNTIDIIPINNIQSDITKIITVNPLDNNPKNFHNAVSGLFSVTLTDNAFEELTDKLFSDCVFHQLRAGAEDAGLNQLKSKIEEAMNNDASIAHLAIRNQAKTKDVQQNPPVINYEPGEIINQFVEVFNGRTPFSLQQIQELIFRNFVIRHDAKYSIFSSKTITQQIHEEWSQLHERVLNQIVSQVKNRASDLGMTNFANLLDDQQPANRNIINTFKNWLDTPAAVNLTTQQVFDTLIESNSNELLDRLGPDAQANVRFPTELKAEQLRKQLIAQATANGLGKLAAMLSFKPDTTDNFNVHNALYAVIAAANAGQAINQIAQDTLNALVDTNSGYDNYFNIRAFNTPPTADAVKAELKAEGLRKQLLQVANGPALPLQELARVLVAHDSRMDNALSTYVDNQLRNPNLPINQQVAEDVLKDLITHNRGLPAILGTVPPTANLTAEYDKLVKAERVRAELSRIANDPAYQFTDLRTHLDDPTRWNKILQKLRSRPNENAKDILHDLMSKATVNQEANLIRALKNIVGDDLVINPADPIVTQIQAKQKSHFISLTDEMKARPALAKLLTGSLMDVAGFKFKLENFSAKKLKQLDTEIANVPTGADAAEKVREIIIQFCFGDDILLTQSQKQNLIRTCFANPGQLTHAQALELCKQIRAQTQILSQFGANYVRELNALQLKAALPPNTPNALEVLTNHVATQADWRSYLDGKERELVAEDTIQMPTLLARHFSSNVDPADPNNQVIAGKTRNIQRLHRVLGSEIVDFLYKAKVLDAVINTIDGKVDWQQRLASLMHMLVDSNYVPASALIQVPTGFIDESDRNLWNNQVLTKLHALGQASFEEIKGIARLQEFFGKEFVDLLRSLDLLSKAAKRVGSWGNDDWEKNLRTQATEIERWVDRPGHQISCLSPVKGNPAVAWHLFAEPVTDNLSPAQKQQLSDNAPLAASRVALILNNLRTAGMLEFASRLDALYGKFLFDYFRTHSVPTDLEQQVSNLKQALSKADPTSPNEIPDAIEAFLDEIIPDVAPAMIQTQANEMTKGHEVLLRGQAIYGQFLEALKHVCGKEVGLVLDAGMHTDLVKQMNLIFPHVLNDNTLPQKIYEKVKEIKTILSNSATNLANKKVALSAALANLNLGNSHDQEITLVVNALNSNTNAHVARELRTFKIASGIDDPILAEYAKSFYAGREDDYLTDYVVNEINDLLAGNIYKEDSKIVDYNKVVNALPRGLKSQFFSTDKNHERSFEKWRLFHERFNAVYELKQPVLRKALLRNAYLLADLSDPNAKITRDDIRALNNIIPPPGGGTPASFRTNIQNFSAGSPFFNNLVRSLAQPTSAPSVNSQTLNDYWEDRRIINDILQAAASANPPVHEHPVIKLLMNSHVAFRGLTTAKIQNNIAVIETILNGDYDRQQFDTLLYSAITGLGAFANNELWNNDHIYFLYKNHKTYSKLTSGNQADFDNAISQINEHINDHESLKAEEKKQEELKKLQKDILKYESYSQYHRPHALDAKKIQELKEFKENKIDKLVAKYRRNENHYQEILSDYKNELASLEKAKVVAATPKKQAAIQKAIDKLKKRIELYEKNQKLYEANIATLEYISKDINERIDVGTTQLRLQNTLYSVSCYDWFEPKNPDGTAAPPAIQQLEARVKAEAGIKINAGAGASVPFEIKPGKVEYLDFKRPSDKSENAVLAFADYCGDVIPTGNAKYLKGTVQSGVIRIHEFPSDRKSSPNIFVNDPTTRTDIAAWKIAQMYVDSAGSSGLIQVNGIQDKYMGELILQRIHAIIIERAEKQHIPKPRVIKGGRLASLDEQELIKKAIELNKHKNKITSTKLNEAKLDKENVKAEEHQNLLARTLRSLRRG